MYGETETFFSRISLKSARRATNDLLGKLSTPEGEHHVLWNFFGDKPDRDRDFLFRRLLNDRMPTFLVLSERRPENPNSQMWSTEVKPFDPDFHEGMKLRFSLRANATVKKNGSYHDVVMNHKYELEHEQGVDRENWPPQSVIEHEAGWDWIRKRDEKNGFLVDEESYQVERHETHRFTKQNSDRRVHLGMLDMTGLLEIINLERFIDTLRNGMGRSKAYGCGMMMVKLP